MSKKEFDRKWEAFKKVHYGSKTCIMCEWGVIDFDKEKMKEVAGGEKLTYDEYLDILKESGKNCRSWFEMCYYQYSLGFKGEIEKKNNKNICFKRIYVSGMYNDGICFDGKEDHVWMDIKGFENYQVGDNISFSAEIYRYLITSNGKIIDFGLRNPSGIKKVNSYELPSDDDLLKQEINQLVCEVCFLNEHCSMGMCIADKKLRDNMKKSLFKSVKNK